MADIFASPTQFATLLVLDCGPTMWRSRDGEESQLSKACLAIRHLLHSKIIEGKKKDLVSLVLVGSNETNLACKNLDAEEGYKNINVKYPVMMADLDMLSFVTDGCEQGDEPGDIVDGIVVGIQVLEDFCAHRKWSKQIYVFTDGKSAINPDEIQAIKEKAVDYEVRVNIMGPITMGDPDADNHWRLDVYVYGKIMEVKPPSAKKWSKIAATSADLPEGIVPGTVSMSRTYKLAHQSIEDGDDGQMKIAEEQTYEQDELTKAYKYGKDIVPFSEQDRDAMSKVGQGSKGFHVIGFIDKNDVPRQAYLGNPLHIVADPYVPRAKTVMETFALTLTTKSMAALCRYHRTEKSAMKLGILLPHPLRSKTWLTFIQVPFKEDIREYAFPSLTPLLEDFKQGALPSTYTGGQSATRGATLTQNGASQNGSSDTQGSTSSSQSLLSSVLKGTQESIMTLKKQKALINKRKVDTDEADARIDALIQSMDLMTADVDDDGNPCEAYKPANVFNPTYQRMYQCIAHRAMHQEDKTLPPVDPRFVAGIQPLPELVEKAKPHVALIKEAFEVTAVEKKETNKAKFGKKIGEAMAGIDGDGADEAMMDSEGINLSKITDSLVTSVGTAEPVSDFKAMISRRDVDLLTIAVTQMTEVISKLMRSFGSQHFTKALHCIEALRQGCIEQSEVVTYNDWIVGFKREVVANKDFWAVFSGPEWRKKVAPISSVESGESSLSHEDVEEFFNVGNVDEEAQKAEVPNVDDDQDMLDLLE
ncbi:X-ray repair cross-complementing protein 5 [Irineochytrium annulatum]|nr:X-ray repair cross-complementing protein 5 [Irineochytrium annulatum]